MQDIRVIRQWVRYGKAITEGDHKTTETERNQKIEGVRHRGESRALVTEDRGFRHPFTIIRGRWLLLKNRDQGLKNFDLCNFLMFIIFTINHSKEIISPKIN